MSRASAHAGQNHDVCLSVHGRLPGTLRYTYVLVDSVYTSSAVTFVNAVLWLFVCFACCVSDSVCFTTSENDKTVQTANLTTIAA